MKKYGRVHVDHSVFVVRLHVRKCGTGLGMVSDGEGKERGVGPGGQSGSDVLSDPFEQVVLAGCAVRDGEEHVGQFAAVQRERIAVPFQ